MSGTPPRKQFSPEELAALQHAMDVLMSRFDLAIIHLRSPDGLSASFMPLKRQLPVEVIRDLNDNGRNSIQQALNLPRPPVAMSSGTATAVVGEHKAGS